jgi:hypothetical protein
MGSAVITRGRRPVGVKGEVMEIRRRLQSMEECPGELREDFWAPYWEH